MLLTLACIGTKKMSSIIKKNTKNIKQIKVSAKKICFVIVHQINKYYTS